MGVFGSPFLHVPAWAPVVAKTRYPEQGKTYAVDRGYLGGVLGLDPAGGAASGVATFFWTSDEEGRNIVGVQGFSLASLIPSMAQLALPNHGPNLYLTVEPFGGKPAPLGCTLFCKDVPRALPGDTILVDVHGRPLAAQTVETTYPADYYSGFARVYLSAPPDVAVTLYGADLTYQWWPLDSSGPGSFTTILPMGAWMAVVSNPTKRDIEYTLSVTPLT